MGKPKSPKVLIYDIETSPILAWVWNAYQTNIIRPVKDREILCFAYKWLGEKKIHFVGREGKRGLKSEKSVVNRLWDLMNKADVVLGYNSEDFDNAICETKFLIHKLGPTSPYQSIDPIKTNRRRFRFTTNKLDNVCRELGIKGKVKHRGFDMWEEVMKNDKQGWREMQEYNVGDIPSLEEVYLRIRSWIKSHPHMGSIVGKPAACPFCGGERLKSYGRGVRGLFEYTRFRCLDCLAFCRGVERLKRERVYFTK